MLLQVTIIIFFNGSEADVQSSNINATSIPLADVNPVPSNACEFNWSPQYLILNL